MAKSDDILQHVIEVKEDTAGIKEHLKQLNGQVISNVNAIENNRQEITNVRLTMAKWVGGLSILLIAVEVLLKFI